MECSGVSRSLGTSENTARRYIDILSGAYMVRVLPPWFENLKKRQKKSPKIYIRDSGVCHSLLQIPSHEVLEGHPRIGVSWEGFAWNTLSMPFVPATPIIGPPRRYGARSHDPCGRQTVWL